MVLDDKPRRLGRAVEHASTGTHENDGAPLDSRRAPLVSARGARRLRVCEGAGPPRVRIAARLNHTPKLMRTQNRQASGPLGLDNLKKARGSFVKSEDCGL